MNYRELEFQRRVLQVLDKYLEQLSVGKENAQNVQQIIAENPDVQIPIPDFCETAWKKLKESNDLPKSRSEIDYSRRETGTGKPVPNIVYKVPTGGGKTYLAVQSAVKIFSQYLYRNKGLILWIVPNQAIYQQTRKYLSDRQHPYRRIFEMFSDNSFKLLEKNTPLHKHDIEQNLCVMLLMLQSGARKSKETLKIFQERGDVNGFIPDEGDKIAHRDLLGEIANLDGYDPDGIPIMDSLGNALRIIRPVIIMDEGHKAVSDLAHGTLYGFNPSFVLELTATPKDSPDRHQNILVDVTGAELDREKMIKMPIVLDFYQSANWTETLQAAITRLNDLTEKAKKLQDKTSKYIRPILLIQVERTGKDQRDGQHIHTEDVKQWLLQTGKFNESEIAIKTANSNDLKSPDNQDLLSQSSSVRIIITKSALQEGWDCSFAYALCSLAPSSSNTAMTQLIGRILRQPSAEKTGIQELDQCYVIAHHGTTAEVVETIISGLERSGMGDMKGIIKTNQKEPPSIDKIARRKEFANDAIMLPKITVSNDQGEREFDFDEDIFLQIKWENLDIHEFLEMIPEKIQSENQRQIQIHSDFSTTESKTMHYEKKMNLVEITYSISKIISNPWQAYIMVDNVISGLRKRGFDEKDLGIYSGYISDRLINWLEDEQDKIAEEIYTEAVEKNIFQYNLYMDRNKIEHNWIMPNEFTISEPDNQVELKGDTNTPIQKSLFQPVYKSDLNDEERKVAQFLDKQDGLVWWHRNIVFHQYSVQGWRIGRIFPDFIFAIRTSEAGPDKIIVLEMKGEHLYGNDDTVYKEKVLKLLSEAFKIII